MKYLDYPVLTQLSHVLSSNPTPEARTNARVETYSIKQIKGDRKMFREMEEQYVSGQEDMDEMSFSPEMKQAGLSSCFGRLDVKESRKVHFLLVNTLNSAFSGYDFSALRPDHFTREISAAQVLSHLSTNLLAIDGLDLSPLAITLPNPSGSPPSYSPSLGSSPKGTDVGNPSLYRILNEVVPLNECEVYSWFPEPEYDPHVEPEENEEASEYDEEDSEEFLSLDDDPMDIDDGPISWGQAGMELELDDVPETSALPNQTRSVRSMSLSSAIDFSDLAMFSPTLGAISDSGHGRKVGGLLWSANYFFYSKRQKRVLLITAWCRKRPSHDDAQPTDQFESGSLPLPISSSFTSPSTTFQSLASQSAKSRPPRVSHHNLSNARPNHRRSKLASKLATGRTLAAQTIPIRSSVTAQDPVTPVRFASSAPAPTMPPIASPSFRVNTGIKPRQTSARLMINANAKAAAASKAEPTTAQMSGSVEGESSRVRKERSGSLTPGPGLGLVDALTSSGVGSDVAKGKRVKV
ncbi:uncharacterized protein CcaverHIS019_0111670 [Cutaneotrichosporon cavernicola]|uniref:Maf1-domain-containing protein n=1 Tax=Cutaneotrichosporon cavernicola TaxID=279322 RepID=A0AA48HZJ8_9TREE|nr:uncharacterized protein CcaverHIS019_0111670 [Cutaneotrichosporon cavernicola]BEI88449.1 hypothetical protein CcaverHIS019_0111670 [Cutaneotrichosporon cavernicola]BEI96222.1 hypothetical protein CcaverHIS631_0111710 [Cutaneotrichosporon cavernicola]BEJ03993.1 hypothetical protein CcaverHIS641_0111680 [Cutaneotrichosporon cavernicola]